MTRYNLDLREEEQQNPSHIMHTEFLYTETEVNVFFTGKRSNHLKLQYFFLMLK